MCNIYVIKASDNILNVIATKVAEQYELSGDDDTVMDDDEQEDAECKMDHLAGNCDDDVRMVDGDYVAGDDNGMDNCEDDVDVVNCNAEDMNAAIDDVGEGSDDEGVDALQAELIALVEERSFGRAASLVPTRCAAHTIQLAVHDCLSHYSAEVVAVKEGCTKIRRTIRELDLPDAMPPNSNMTRWLSYFKMVEGMLKIRSGVFERTMTSELWSFTETMMKGSVMKGSDSPPPK